MLYSSQDQPSTIVPPIIVWADTFAPVPAELVKTARGGEHPDEDPFEIYIEGRRVAQQTPATAPVGAYCSLEWADRRDIARWSGSKWIVVASTAECTSHSQTRHTGSWPPQQLIQHEDYMQKQQKKQKQKPGMWTLIRISNHWEDQPYGVKIVRAADADGCCTVQILDGTRAGEQVRCLRERVFRMRELPVTEARRRQRTHQQRWSMPALRDRNDWIAQDPAQKLQRRIAAWVVGW